MSKGISPLIAAVLLIAFTLAVAAIVSGFLSTIAKTGTTQISTGFALQVNCTKAALDIVDAACVNHLGLSGVVNNSVAIANVGPVALTSPQIYVRSVSQKVCVGLFTDTLNPGISRVYRINCTSTSTGAWGTADVLQYVRVTANCLNEKAISIERDNIGDACS